MRREPSWAVVARLTVVFVLGALMVALLYRYCTLVPVVVVPLIAGITKGLQLETVAVAALIGASSSLVGAPSATVECRADRIALTLQSLQACGVFEYAFADIPLSFLNTLRSIWFTSPINTALPGVEMFTTLVIATLTGGVAGGVASARATNGGARFGRIAPWCAVALLAASMLWTGLRASEAFRAAVNEEPVDRTCAYDPVFNLKTYELMKLGQGFRQSYIYAMSKDATKEEFFTVIEDGMFKLKGGSPAFQRQPASFYLWRILGARKASDIVIVSLVWRCLLPVGFFWGLRDRLTSRAIAIVSIVSPLLLLLTNWFNVIFPEWLAVLVFSLSVIATLRERYWIAGALGLVACLFREILALWLIALAAAAIPRWLKGDKAGWRLAAGYVANIAAFVAAFAWHCRTGARYTARCTVERSSAWFADLISKAMALGTTTKLLKPTSYLMLPYGFYAIPGYLFLPLGAAGFWLATRPGSAARYALMSVYPLLALVLYATTGAMSSYWGMHVMPVAMVGVATLISSAGKIAVVLASGRARR